MAGSYIIFISSFFGELPDWFSKRLYQFILQAAVAKSSSFPTSAPQYGVADIADNSNSGWEEMGYFKQHFTDDKDVECS